MFVNKFVNIFVNNAACLNIVVNKGACLMKLVKITKVVTDTIAIRVPLQVKAEFESLRKLAKKHEVDLTASLAESLEHIFKEFRAELEGLDKKPAQHVNGALHSKADA
jgi:hypothetical protein